jgi:hypothetical protein
MKAMESKVEVDVPFQEILTSTPVFMPAIRLRQQQQVKLRMVLCEQQFVPFISKTSDSASSNSPSKLSSDLMAIFGDVN